MDDGTVMTMELAEIQTAKTGNIYVYEVEYDGVLDHTIQVDLENDIATMFHADGKIETIVISENVRVTEIKEAGVPSFHPITVKPAKPMLETVAGESSTRAYTNYIYSELLEIDANGNQLMLGNEVYGNGYELVGSVSFTNPQEIGYLLRKPMGYEVFEARYYELDEGVHKDFAVSILMTFLGVVTNNAAAVLRQALKVLGIIVGEVVAYATAGYINCREYRWDYRVKQNSPYNTTLFETTKYRYWWEITKNGSTVKHYGERTDIVDGIQLSNFDIVAAGLGRIPGFVDN